MCGAVKNLSVPADYVIIDGNSIKGMELPHETVVKGDAKSSSIAAASILAKVTRDRLLLEYDEKYPQYNFKKHKGYGTKLHYEMIEKYGVSLEELTDIYVNGVINSELSEEVIKELCKK